MIPRRYPLSVLAPAALLLVACGAGEPTPAAPAASAEASAAPSASASPDMPAPAAETAAPAAAPPPPAEAPALVPVAMKLVAPKVKHKIEVKADGMVMLDGKPAWKMTGPGLFEIKHPEEPILKIAGDGTVTGFMVQKKDSMRFDEKDDLVDPTGHVSIADDGTITLPEKIRADFGDMKLTGFKPAARRAASLVLLQTIIAVSFEKEVAAMKAKKKK
jgi:hypothetical protein